MKLKEREKQDIQVKYGPWAIVTGASSGIGEELARQLATCQMNLVVVARNERKLSELAHDLSHGAQHPSQSRGCRLGIHGGGNAAAGCSGRI